MSAGDGGNDLGGSRTAAEAGGGAIAPLFEREDFVEAAGFAHAAKFERGLKREALLAGAEGDEWIGDADAAEIELIRVGDGVGVEERRERGASHEVFGS